MTKIIEGITLRDYSVKVIPSYMKKYQFKAYKKIDVNNLNDNVYRNSIYYSLIAF